MNYKLISKYVGMALSFESAIMFMSVLVSALNGADSSFSALLISSLVTLMVGLFPLIFVRSSEDISLKDGFAITSLSWLLTCIFGTFPYLLWGEEFSIVNAWFESVSGFTTTGSTILSDVEALPAGLLFYRSASHFLGGLGVVAFMLIVLPAMSTFRMKMFKMEISSLSKDNYRFKTRNSLKVIISVYMGIFVTTFISLMLAGMPAFDALNHSMSITATGGFSIKNTSVAAYGSLSIELVSMIFMLISGLHFGLVYAMVVKRSGRIFRNPVIRFYILVLAISTVTISINLIAAGGNVVSWGDSFRKAAFQVISVSTSSGFATADTSVWPAFSILVLILLSVMGACAGSTTGGLKADRVWIFIKSLKVQVNRQLHPNAVIPIRVGNQIIDSDASVSVTVYIALYLLIAMLSALALSATGMNLQDSFTSSIASIGNIGPAFGHYGSMANYGQCSGLAKIILTVEMLLGRVEIYPLLLMSVFFKNK